MEQISRPHWAKVDALHIARFGELTKREIQVICSLFLCRNGKSDRCNPKRKTICELTGLPRSHVSTAIAGLETKGWIIEMPDGEFVLFPADSIPDPEPFAPVENPCGNVEKVTELVTTKPAESVTDLVTTVTDSVTKRYQNGNEHNKDLEQTLNNEGTEKRALKPKKKSAKAKGSRTRIPDPFPLTDEMRSWAIANVPDLQLIGAQLDFVEYWTNAPENQKAYATNWRLRWEKGMRLLLKWQLRDAGIDPDPNPNCSVCRGEGRTRGVDWSPPCDRCQPNRSKRFWKDRGK